MRLLITSVVDPENSAHCRVHEFARYLSRRHDVTILSINDCWKKKQKSSSTYHEDWIASASNITLKHLTDENLTLMRQEMFSKSLAKESTKNLIKSGVDVILDYNTIRIGQNVASLLKGVPRIYDLADDLVDMIRNSPQLSPVIARIGSLVSRHYVRTSIEKADFVTGTSGALLNEYGVSEAKRRILPNGVPVAFLEPVQQSEIIDIRDDENEFVIGYVGVLREWVDFEPVMNAIRRLRHSRHVRLMIIGEEGDMGRTIRMARAKGIESSVSMMGSVNHNKIRRYLSSCDCGIIPFSQTMTSNLALPLKLFEYFAANIPVISTPILAIKEDFEDEVFIYNMTEDLVRLISSLMDSPDLGRERARLGKEKVRKSYTWEGNLPILEELIMNSVS